MGRNELSSILARSGKKNIAVVRSMLTSFIVYSREKKKVEFITGNKRSYRITPLVTLEKYFPFFFPFHSIPFSFLYREGKIEK